MATTLPKVTVGADPAGQGIRAACSACDFDIVRPARFQADLEAAEHRASHATPLHEDDEAPDFRLDTAGSWS